MTRRLDEIRSSGIRKIFEKAARLQDKVDFSIGQPPFPAPDSVKESLKRAIDADKMTYTPSAGIDPLRNKIMEKYAGHQFAQAAIVTPGVTEAIPEAYAALLEEKDELLVLDPYFVVYPDLCNFLGAKARIVSTTKDWRPDIDALEREMSDPLRPKPRAMIINSPNNPTGVVYTRAEMQSIADFARRHDLWVISDEIYEQYVYTGKFVSMGSLYDKTIVLNGFSKSLAIPGLRVGYAVGPKEVIADMVKYQQYNAVSVNSIGQWAAYENFNYDIGERRTEMEKKRTFLFQNLNRDYELYMPEGAFYAFVKTPDQTSGDEFSDKCLGEQLLAVPGNAFSRKDDHVRISFATSDKQLERGVEILQRLAKQYAKQ